MTFIVTALHCEAAPIIDRFALKKELTSSFHEVFRSEEYTLIVSGIGRLRSAIATTYLVTKFSGGENRSVVNLGVAGAAAGREVGELFWIQKITDRVTGKVYLPDMLLKCGIPRGELETFDRPVTDAKELLSPQALVDMEGAGFFQSASTFTAPSRISLLKIVSDSLKGEHLIESFVFHLIASRLEEIERFLEQLRLLPTQEHEVLLPHEAELIERFSRSLRLTHSQRRLLTDAARSRRIRNGRAIEAKDFPNTAAPASKREAREVFQRVYSALAQS